MSFLNIVSPQRCLALIVLGTFSTVAFGFENAVLLPKGVRRVYIRNVHTDFSERTDGSGNAESLASPLQKNVTYEDFIKVRKGSERTQLEAFLLANDIDKKENVGSLSADLNADVNVFVPTFAYGFSNKLNIGLAVPIYSAKTSVSVAFKPNKKADEFVNLLADPQTGQTDKAREAAEAINDVVGTLNQKLSDNGYDELGDWSSTGLGDAFVKAKYANVDAQFLRLATHGGVVAPTGKTDDPDNLTDIAFGDGSWDLFLGENVDVPFWGPLFFNVMAQYTMQFPAKREVRLKTKEEPIAVDKKEVRYDLGDKVDAEASLQMDHDSGFLTGVGYAYYKKFADDYSNDDAGESAFLYEEDTEQESHVAEGQLGYSSVTPYRRGKMAVPFETSATYQKHLQSWNLPKADRFIVDLKLYF